MLSIFSFDQMVGFFNTGGTTRFPQHLNVTRDFAMALIPGMDWNSRTLIFTTYLEQVGFNPFDEDCSDGSFNHQLDIVVTCCNLCEDAEWESNPIN